MLYFAQNTFNESKFFTLFHIIYIILDFKLTLHTCWFYFVVWIGCPIPWSRCCKLDSWSPLTAINEWYGLYQIGQLYFPKTFLVPIISWVSLEDAKAPSWGWFKHMKVSLAGKCDSHCAILAPGTQFITVKISDSK